MVSIASLWLPILVSAVFVFLVSSVVHMVLPYHRTDFDKVPREDEVMEALRKFDLKPGEYVLPYAGSPEVMKSKEYLDKANEGPVGFVTVFPSGPPAVGSSLIQWFVYSIIVSVMAAYVAGRALEPGASYLEVFRYSGTAAFMCYSVALWQNSIWYKRTWSTTAKSSFDGLLYALATAGVFGWLWPS